MKIATIKTAADKKAHVITRSGKRKDQGGAGVMWRCSCSRKKACVRLRDLVYGRLYTQDVTLFSVGEQRFFDYVTSDGAVRVVPAGRSAK